MVVIFGWGAGEGKDLGETAPLACPNCRNEVFLHHIRSEKRVSLYFVPLIPYGTDEYLACPVCRHGLPVPKERRAVVERMRAQTGSYRRGRIPEATYRAGVARFWSQMGVTAAAMAPPAAGPPGPAPAARSGPRPASATRPAAGPSPARATPNLAEQLAGLARLHADGVLTDEELAAAKRRLLGT
jgi:uncharacterized protein YbaR (Trm112 family)